MQTNLCETDERHALIIGYSRAKGNLHALPTVLESVDLVESFARRYEFTSVNVLKDSQATKNAITKLFAE